MGDEEPKPKRRSALRHALGGLAFLSCLALSMWLIERAGWTDIGGTWQQLTVQLSGGPRAVRERAKVGMTQREIHRWIGTGTRQSVGPGVVVEDYGEGFRVVYGGAYTHDNCGLVVTGVEDLP